jgi:hypothetical protein
MRGVTPLTGVPVIAACLWMVSVVSAHTPEAFGTVFLEDQVKLAFNGKQWLLFVD